MLNSKVYRHMKSPDGFGRPPFADSVGAAGNFDRVGPFFEVYLTLKEDRVVEFRFETYRCPWSMASGSLLTRLVNGRTVAEALKIEFSDLEKELGNVPDAKGETVRLAIRALKNALNNSLSVRGDAGP